jgi:hypothetical protein
VAYQSGELGPERSEAVRQHTLLCPDCELGLERLRAFDHAVSGAQAGPRRSGFGRFFWNPVLGYGLTLLLAYPAYLGLRPSKPTPVVAPKQHEVTIPQVVRLKQVRGPAATITVRPGEKQLSLAFFVPWKPGRRYFAELTGPGGRLIGERQELPNAGAGDAILVAEVAALTSGEYRVAVTETTVDGGKTEGQFDYSFELRIPGAESK